MFYHPINIIQKATDSLKKHSILTYLQKNNWVHIELVSRNKNIYIFSNNNILKKITNAVVSNNKYELLNNSTLSIKEEVELLFKINFIDKKVLFLKLNSNKPQYAFFINEKYYDKGINNLKEFTKFIQKEYLNKTNYTTVIDFKPKKITPSEKLIKLQNKWVKDENKCSGCGADILTTDSECHKCGSSIIKDII